MPRQSTTRKRKGGRQAETASVPADPRLVALVKYLARRAAERDYKVIQDRTAGQAITLQQSESDAETES